jgi:hypothetical protein
MDGLVVSLSHLALLVRRLVIDSSRDSMAHFYHCDQTRSPPIPPLVRPPLPCAVPS